MTEIFCIRIVVVETQIYSVIQFQNSTGVCGTMAKTGELKSDCWMVCQYPGCLSTGAAVPQPCVMGIEGQAGKGHTHDPILSLTTWANSKCSLLQYKLLYYKLVYCILTYTHKRPTFNKKMSSLNVGLSPCSHCQRPPAHQRSDLPSPTHPQKHLQPWLPQGHI